MTETEREDSPKNGGGDSTHTKHHLTRTVIGIVLVSIAIVGVAYPLWWNNRSTQGAKRILHHDISQIQRVNSHSSNAGRACLAQPGPGILSIPSLSLTAPVEQGLEDAVLNVAIGHDPATSWPGPSSAALFAAHDVSFFSHLNQLAPGAIITYTVPCATYTFRVEGAQVTSPGAPISVPNQGALVLDTCYPPNALWYTPDRYIVTASYISTQPEVAQITTNLGSSPPPMANYTFAAPTNLAPQDLLLANNSQEMGQLTFTGNPSANFQQSNDPLSVEAVGLQGWFAVLHTIEDDQPSWWKSFAPNIPFPQGLAGQQLKSTSPLEISEDITGSTPNSITLTGGENSKTFTVTANFSGATMSLTSFSVS